MTPDQLVAHSPRLYHVTPTAHVESIRRYGLLSTSALLDRFGVTGAERIRLEGARRGRPEVLEHPTWGRLVLRDQHPLSIRGLERALGGSMSVEAWLRLINSRVFFFPSVERLQRLAKAYVHERQSVLMIDTARLVELRSADIEISHMNTGATAPVAHPRAPNTFRPMNEYPYVERRHLYGKSKALAEVTVLGALPEVATLILGVTAVEDCC